MQHPCCNQAPFARPRALQEPLRSLPTPPSLAVLHTSNRRRPPPAPVRRPRPLSRLSVSSHADAPDHPLAIPSVYRTLDTSRPRQASARILLRNWHYRNHRGWDIYISPSYYLLSCKPARPSCTAAPE